MIWVSGLSALFGALIGLVGTLIVSGRQLRTERESRQSDLTEDRLKERRRQYVDLLAASRKLRFIALRTFQQLPHSGDPDEILTDMATALYSIKLIAPKQSAELAVQFHDHAVTFWRLSRDHADAPEKEWKAKRDAVTAAVEEFREHTRLEFEQASGQTLGRLDHP